MASPEPPYQWSIRHHGYALYVRDAPLHWPPYCPCCMDPADCTIRLMRQEDEQRHGATAAGAIVVLLSMLLHAALSASIPYCRRCRSHRRWSEEAPLGQATLWTIILVSVIAILGLLFSGDLIAVRVFALPTAGLLVVLAFYWLRLLAKRKLPPRCASQGDAVRYIEDIARRKMFVFQNKDYAEQFVRANIQATTP